MYILLDIFKNTLYELQVCNTKVVPEELIRIVFFFLSCSTSMQKLRFIQKLPKTLVNCMYLCYSAYFEE